MQKFLEGFEKMLQKKQKKDLNITETEFLNQFMALWNEYRPEVSILFLHNKLDCQMARSSKN